MSLRPFGRVALTKRDRRDQVRTQRLDIEPNCQARATFPEFDCAVVSYDRPLLEVHEIVPRSLACNAELVLDLTRTVCQAHHNNLLTEPTPLQRKRAEAARLLAPSWAVVYEAKDPDLGLRLPSLREGWGS